MNYVLWSRHLKKKPFLPLGLRKDLTHNYNTSDTCMVVGLVWGPN